MNRIVAVSVIVFVATLMFIACCGFNRSFFDTKWTFKTAYINLGGDYGTVCVKIKSWKDFDNSDCVQITTVDGITYVSHYSHCTLCSSPDPRK